MGKLFLFIVLATSVIYSQVFEFVGTSACKMCHTKEEKGAQYRIWEESRHSQAFETLKSEEAAQIAKERGLQDNAWESAECLICHTTGFSNGGYEVMDETFWSPDPDDRDANRNVKRMTGLQAVGCEACHGAGSEYKSKKKMEMIYSDELDGSTVGLIEPNEETCKTCHNSKSPTFKSFVFEEFFKKIAHPVP